MLQNLDRQMSLEDMNTTYDRVQHQVVSTLGDDPLRSEFAKLFPAEPMAVRATARSAVIPPHDSSGVEGLANLKTHLAGVAGWLGGLIEAEEREAQIKANADAYAKEKLAADRGVRSHSGE
jgi:hypothetical protein